MRRMIVSFHNMFFFVLTENGKIFSSRTRIIKKMESYNIFKKKSLRARTPMISQGTNSKYKNMKINKQTQ